MPSLNEIISKMERPKLKPTATVVRGSDGRVKVERQELLSSSEQQAKIAASVEAGKKRGESRKKYKSGSLAWKGAVVKTPERIFPSCDGEVYEFQPDMIKNSEDDWKQGEWMVAPVRFRPGEQDSLLFDTRRVIKVATFNVWFDELEWKKRTEALMDLLVQVEQIDVICLQEVTPRCLGEILKIEEIRQMYRVTDRGPNYQTIGAYGVVMLVRRTLPVPYIQWVSLPTGMGRSGLLASFQTNKQEQKLAIATVHLESLSSRSIRAKQLEILHSVLRPYFAAILVGDYNISATGPYGNPSEHEDLFSIMEGYTDLWLQENGNDGDDENSPHFLHSITYDSTANTMLKVDKRRRGAMPDHSRLDRVFVRSSSSDDNVQNRTSICAHTIRRIGDVPVEPNLFVSDHYGLAFEVTLMETGAWMIPKREKQQSGEEDANQQKAGKSRAFIPPNRPAKTRTTTTAEMLEGTKTNLFGI